MTEVSVSPDVDRIGRVLNQGAQRSSVRHVNREQALGKQAIGPNSRRLDPRYSQSKELLADFGVSHALRKRDSLKDLASQLLRRQVSHPRICGQHPFQQGNRPIRQHAQPALVAPLEVCPSAPPCYPKTTLSKRLAERQR